jgi:hypothetical protein
MSAEPNSDQSAIVADAIRREFSLGANIERFATGSLPVFAAGDSCVVKLGHADLESLARSWFAT